MGQDESTPPQPRGGVEDHHTASAEEFLEALSPRRAPWREHPPAWIHRGQANAGGPLQARAVREGEGAFAKYGIAGRASGWSARKDIHDRMLERFQKGLDAS